MSVLALIPARGGSKRLHRKSLAPLAGRALIGWTVQSALEAELVDRVMVSTDDPEIAGVAQGWGAEVIERPAALATDHASTDSVIAHALEPERDVDLVVLLQPTVPVREPGLIDACIRRLRATGADSLLTANRLHFVWWRGQRVLFQTEAGPQIGYGHAVRSIAVAQECARLGADVALSVADPVARDMVRRAGVRAAVPADEDLAGAVVRDFRTGWPSARQGIPSVDLADEVEDASGEAAATFAMLGRPGPGIFAGLEYAAIRRQFRDVARVDLGYVVVALGGADPTNSTRRLCDGLIARGIPALGASRFSADTQIWDTLASASVAVTSGGMTMFEAASLGLPVLAYANNDRERGRLLRMQEAAHGWFWFLGMAQDATPAAIETAVRQINPTTHAAMATDGQARVDGRGAERIARSILERAGSWRTQCPSRPRLQDMTPRDFMWHEDGSVFVVTREFFERTGSRVGGRMEVFETERTIDIDTDADLAMAERMLEVAERMNA